MERLCGTNEIPKDIHAPAGKIVILYFESDESYNFRGFSLDWSKNCGGNVIVESQGQGLFATYQSISTGPSTFNMADHFQLGNAFSTEAVTV